VIAAGLLAGSIVVVTTAFVVTYLTGILLVSVLGRPNIRPPRTAR
jgi:hypothetical protein